MIHFEHVSACSYDYNYSKETLDLQKETRIQCVKHLYCVPISVLYFSTFQRKKELHGELHIIIMKVLYQNVPQLKNPQIRLSFLTGEFFSNGLILEMYDYSPLPNFRTMSSFYTPWKHEKTPEYTRFACVSRRYEMRILIRNGWNIRRQSVITKFADQESLENGIFWQCGEITNKKLCI